MVGTEAGQSSNNGGAVAGKVAGFIALQGGESDCSGLKSDVTVNRSTLENKGGLLHKKTPCNYLQDVREGGKVGETGLVKNVENALFSRGESDSGKWRFPEKFPESEKVGLILDLIDSLNWEEKEQLFERLDSVSR